MTIIELFDRFPNDEAAKEWFESTKMGNNKDKAFVFPLWKC